jgi:hypothetical protein
MGWEGSFAQRYFQAVIAKLINFIFYGEVFFSKPPASCCCIFLSQINQCSSGAFLGEHWCHCGPKWKTSSRW